LKQSALSSVSQEEVWFKSQVSCSHTLSDDKRKRIENCQSLRLKSIISSTNSHDIDGSSPESFVMTLSQYDFDFLGTTDNTQFSPFDEVSSNLMSEMNWRDWLTICAVVVNKQLSHALSMAGVVRFDPASLDDVCVGHWLDRQRTAISQGKLSDERLAALIQATVLASPLLRGVRFNENQADVVKLMLIKTSMQDIDSSESNRPMEVSYSQSSSGIINTTSDIHRGMWLVMSRDLGWVMRRQISRGQEVELYLAPWASTCSDVDNGSVIYKRDYFLSLEEACEYYETHGNKEQTSGDVFSSSSDIGTDVDRPLIKEGNMSSVGHVRAVSRFSSIDAVPSSAHPETLDITPLVSRQNICIGESMLLEDLVSSTLELQQFKTPKYWHSPEHTDIRTSIAELIMLCLQLNNWRDYLPNRLDMIKSVGDFLYFIADSLDEYKDITTLSHRLRLLASRQLALVQQPPAAELSMTPFQPLLPPQQSSRMSFPLLQPLQMQEQRIGALSAQQLSNTEIVFPEFPPEPLPMNDSLEIIDENSSSISYNNRDWKADLSKLLTDIKSIKGTKAKLNMFNAYAQKFKNLAVFKSRETMKVHKTKEFFPLIEAGFDLSCMPSTKSLCQKGGSAREAAMKRREKIFDLLCDCFHPVPEELLCEPLEVASASPISSSERSVISSSIISSTSAVNLDSNGCESPNSRRNTHNYKQFSGTKRSGDALDLVNDTYLGKKRALLVADEEVKALSELCIPPIHGEMRIKKRVSSASMPEVSRSIQPISVDDIPVQRGSVTTSYREVSEDYARATLTAKEKSITASTVLNTIPTSIALTDERSSTDPIIDELWKLAKDTASGVISEAQALDEIKAKQQNLVSLLHATRCPTFAADVCKYSSCIKSKKLVNHSKSCKVQNCTIHGCTPTKNILQHYYSCHESTCILCDSVRNDNTGMSLMEIAVGTEPVVAGGQKGEKLLDNSSKPLSHLLNKYLNLIPDPDTNKNNVDNTAIILKRSSSNPSMPEGKRHDQTGAQTPLSKAFSETPSPPPPRDKYNLSSSQSIGPITPAPTNNHRIKSEVKSNSVTNHFVKYPPRPLRLLKGLGVHEGCGKAHIRVGPNGLPHSSANPCRYMQHPNYNTDPMLAWNETAAGQAIANICSVPHLLDSKYWDSKTNRLLALPAESRWIPGISFHIC
jgi:hypothetical protein